MTLKVISGQFLPKPNDSTEGELIDPFVTVELLGVDRDCKAVW